MQQLAHLYQSSSDHLLEQQFDHAIHLASRFVAFQLIQSPMAHLHALKRLMAKRQFHHHGQRLKQHQHVPYLLLLQQFQRQLLQLT